MKTTLTLLFVIIFCSYTYSQVPEKMDYYAVIYNNSGETLGSQQVGIQISILHGSISGTTVYTETHQPTTDMEGNVFIEVGTGLTNDVFSAIDWSTGPYYIKTEADLDGGSNYSLISTSQLLTVPYAMYAKTAETINGPINEVDPLFSSSAANNISTTDINNWNNKIDTIAGNENAFLNWDKNVNDDFSGSYNDLNNLPNWSDTLNLYARKDYVNSLIIAIGATDKLIGLGFTIEELVNGGHSVNQLLSAGITTNDLHEAGVSATELLNAGITHQELITTGYTISELLSAGVTVSELHAAGISFTELLANGGTVEELTDAGATLSELINAGASIESLINYGFAVSDLLSEGVPIIDLFNAKVGVGTLRENGISDSELTSLDLIGTVTDIDGNVYEWVKIGNQKWMAENLRVTKTNTGTPITNQTADMDWYTLQIQYSDGYCIYNNNSSYEDSFGLLYKFHTSRFVCPTNWTLPSYNDWQELNNYLGGSTESGDKLKSTANGGANCSGFTGLLGGIRRPVCPDYPNGGFEGINEYGTYWAVPAPGDILFLNTIINNENVLHITPEDSQYIIDGYRYDLMGASVRCIKTNP